MNSSLIIRLIEVINGEVRVFHDLFELLQSEQSAIVNDDVETIEAAAVGKQETLERAQRQEAQRQSLVIELSQGLNMAPDSVDLSSLIEAVGGKHGAELSRMRDLLLELNPKIRSINESNAFLIRQSLRYTERSLDILTGQPEQRGVYGNLGKPKKRDGSASVLNHTV